MKIVKVVYTVNAGFVAKNMDNIQVVMNELRGLGSPGILYHVCLSPDGKTFIHTALYRSEEQQGIVTGLASFQYFQEQLKASKPEAPPKQELLTLVGASVDIF